MRRLIELGFERSGWVFVAVVLITGGALYNLRYLSLDVSSESLTNPASPLRSTLADVRTEFGSDQIALVYAEDPELFSFERLERLRDINRALARLPFVEKVDSLFTLPDIRDVGGVLETSPLLARIPREPEALAQKQIYGRENPLLRRNVLSADGTATLLTIYLQPEALAVLPITDIEAELEAVLKPHAHAFAHLYQLGRPALQSWLLNAIKFDQRILLPLAGVLLFILLAFYQRSIIAGLLPILNGVLAVVWTLGIMSLLGIPVTLLNYIVPALIIVVGATEDMHILHEYRTRIAAGATGRSAIEAAGRGIGLALVLTSVSTILGFAATAASTLPILRSFGIAAMIGMSTRFLISIFVLPAVLRPLERVMRCGKIRPLISPELSRLASRALVRSLAPRVIPVVIGLGLLAAVALHFTREIRLSNDLVSFLDQDSSLHQRLAQSSAQLAGAKVLFLTLYDQPGAFLDPVNLRELDALSEYLRNIPELDTVTSFADIVSRIYQQMRGGDPMDARIPDTQAAVQQMLLFTRADNFASYVSADYARANLVIRCNLNDSIQLNQSAADIRAALESGRFGPQEFTLTGEALVVAAAVDSIVLAQVISLGGMIALLFLIVSSLFLSVRCGLLTVLANLFPVLMVFGLMGLSDITLNVGTCMVAAITLGIAIDDTLHLLVRFNRELKSTKREKTAIENALRHELNPMVSTSLALAGGFLVLAFSSFGPVREFGLLSAAVLLLALVTDVAVTPMLFARTRLITLWDIVGLTMRQRLLRESPFFKNLTAWQAKKIILVSQITEAAAGVRIIRQGDLGTVMYVVLSGQLEASIGEGANRRLLTRIGVGDVLGEVALVARVRRSADVTAVVDSRLLTLDLGSLRRLHKFSPFLASRLFLNLAGIIGERLAERIKETAPPTGKA